jgi:succinate-acetate transporter protein
MFAGGIMQGIAAVASLRARDGAAVAVHTAWASFWVGWGVLQILVVVGILAPIPLGAAVPSFAFWFIAMALVTFWGALGALAQNVLVFLTFGVLTVASAVTAAGFWAGSLGTIRVGGWLFVISAAAAWLAAGAMVLEHSFGRTIIPVGKWSRTVNRPGARVTDPITYPGGMPGVKVGR